MRLIQQCERDKNAFRRSKFCHIKWLAFIYVIFIEVFAAIYPFETHSPNKEPFERTQQKNLDQKATEKEKTH